MKQPTSYHSASKQAARKNILENINIPDQYWTTCGNCTKPGTELQQLLELGVIEPDQFHGVDHKKEVYEANLSIKNGAHFYYGDFCEVIEREDDDGRFKPSVVHFDSPEQMGEKQAKEIAKVIATVSTTKYHSEYLIVNSLVKNRCNEKSIQEILDELSRQPLFHHYGKLWNAVMAYPYRDQKSDLVYLVWRKFYDYG